MSKLEQIMSQKMTRRQFLITLSSAFVGLFGLSSLFGILSRNQPADDGPAEYGMRNYGP